MCRLLNKLSNEARDYRFRVVAMIVFALKSLCSGSRWAAKEYIKAIWEDR